VNRGRADHRISSDGSRIVAWFIPTGEELMIAKYTQALLHS
jgi:acetate kinase